MILDAIKYSQKSNFKYFLLGRSKTLFDLDKKNDPKFYNVVIKSITQWKPSELFIAVKNIDNKLGRKRAKIKQ